MLKSGLDSFFEETHLLKKKKNVSNLNKRTKKVRLFKLMLPLFAAFMAGLLLIIPHLKETISNLEEDITKPKLGELEKLQVENTNFHITDADNKVSNFHTSKIYETEPGSKLIKLENPKGTINTKNNDWIKLNAPIGYYNQSQNYINLDNMVNVNLSDGTKINTEKITYDFQNSRGYTDTNIKGVSPLGEINANGMNIHPKNKEINFIGKTKIKLNSRKNKKNDTDTFLKAEQKVDIFQNKNMIIALGNASIIKDNRIIKANKITAFYKKEVNGKNTINDIIAEGDVTISTEKATAKAEKGEYKLEEEIVKLFNNVTIYQDGNIINGDYAETNLNTGVSKVSSGKTGGRVSGIFLEKKNDAE